MSNKRRGNRAKLIEKKCFSDPSMKTLATRRAKKNNKSGGNKQRGPSSSTKSPAGAVANQHTSKKPKPKRRKRGGAKKRHNHSDDRSLPGATLLGRIGETGVLGEEGSEADLDRVNPIIITSIDEERRVLDLPFSSSTPDPGEVERFLESVVGAPPTPEPSPSSSPPRAYLGIRPPLLALETHNPPGVKVEDSSSTVLYSPSQTAVNSLSSANLTLDHSSLPLGDIITMSPPSTATTIEECRKRLVPVLLASAQARDPGRRLDSEQCRRLLSDDHCRRFIRQAKDMRRQLSSLVSQKTPVWGGSQALKRDRTDDVETWIRNTRNGVGVGSSNSRFNSVNTVVSDVSRKDSDITLVDFPGWKSPPKAPRAMLLASSQAAATGWNDKPWNDAQQLGEASCEALVASPITEDHPASATSLLEVVHHAVRLFPALMSTALPMTEIDTSNVPVPPPLPPPPLPPPPPPPAPGTSVGDQLGHPPSQAVSPTLATSPSCPDFVSHQPTQPGVWFSQRGREHAEIVDVDIDVSDALFCASKERLRMHLRLCSVLVDAPCTENDHGTTSPSPLQQQQQVDGATPRGAFRWPKKGKLVVQVNPDREQSHTWLPYALESDPLDVTPCVRPGKNTFRFIQLSDLSAFTFMLTASPLLPGEEWRHWDWAALVARATDNSVGGLSEFARVGVAVRS